MSIPISSTQSMAENRERFSKHFEEKDKDAFSLENFFTLLMAEMSNQDPLEPMSNTDFISNLANFTALKAQQDALYFQNANYAQSLVGKTVTVAAMLGSRFSVETGIVTSMGLADGEFTIKVNGNNYPLSRIMEVTPTNNPFTITGDEGAYATSLIGKQVMITATNDEGRRIVENGIVSRIEIIDNQINVIVGELAYPLSAVIRVEQAGTTSDGTQTATPDQKAYATSLIGKKVTFTEQLEDGKTGYVDTGIVTHFEIVSGQIMMVMGDFSYPLKFVTKVENATAEPPQQTPPPQTSSTITELAAATALIGKEITADSPNGTIKGVVTHVLSGPVIRVAISGGSFVELGNILTVEKPSGS